MTQTDFATSPAGALAPRYGQDLQPLVVGGALALLAAIALGVGGLIGGRYAVNFLWGALLGFTLFRASFGFTGPWRQLIVHRRGAGVRKTLVMLGAAAAVMLTAGALWGYPTVTHPVGAALLIGAFLFGVGMQLGGCCGSGTAYLAGAGSARLMITLVFFIVGSVWGSVDAPFWWGWPKYARFSMLESWGLAPALAGTLALLGLLFWGTLVAERARHGSVATAEVPPARPLDRLLFAPLPPLAAGVVMGVLAGLAVVVTLAPWGVTFGYTLYGVKILAALGIDPGQWAAPGAGTAFWSADWAQRAIAEPLWLNNAANMTIGVMIGAALASGLAGKWKPSFRGVHPLAILAAVLGGLLMGYGARMSTGCNIGALMNGVASGSLHGWAWFAAAFLGNVVTVPLRPLFRMAN